MPPWAMCTFGPVSRPSLRNKMDEVRDKMKGLMKKVNGPFSSSLSGKFKGQGRVLGSSSAASSPSESLPSSASRHNPKPLPQKVNNISEQKLEGKKPEIRRNPNGYSLQVFECPVCGKGYASEEEVSVHVESCLSIADSSEENGSKESDGIGDHLQTCVSQYKSGKPSDGSMEVMMRLFRNVVKEPENAKFRKVRMGNPKIKDAIGDVPGGVELLECVGFELKEEDGEMWLMMEDPSEERLGLIKNVISLLEPETAKESRTVAPAKESMTTAPAKEEPIEPKQVDRQDIVSISGVCARISVFATIRVFFSVPESVAARIEVPASFYNLTAEELRREADARKKKIEESKLLIPKSYREKQAQAAKKRYKRTIIRIQFPDKVVLQAIFSPSESTGTLYEHLLIDNSCIAFVHYSMTHVYTLSLLFVSAALKDPSLEFDLLHPVLIKRRVIPRFPAAGQRPVTLEEEDLVPSALIKFKPIETDDVVFTGLCNELLEISEPLESGSAPS
ncbi:UNVERIFIED_CONTAM: Plant UBX domain-containing protein 2 [Sesamum calycinum]|uniref:Plant UBX domain-containing protein 2 n=1 Tax=Sesamum calycinum TaxID=2727403 RepID=A0AAW2QZ42_9LAMI